MAHALCENLREIVDRLEKGDTSAAAAAAGEMQARLPHFPEGMTEAEADEAQGLLERYDALNTALREKVVGELNRLGAARRSLGYRRGSQRP